MLKIKSANKYVFEHLSAKFISFAAMRLPSELKSLAFSSPLSSRSPDLCMLWHPGYREKHKLRLFFSNLFSFLSAFLKLPFRILGNFKIFTYALYGNVYNTILVVPAICGQALSDKDFITNYVRKKKEDGILVFGPPNTCGKNEKKIQELSVKLKLYYTFSLIKAGFNAYFKLGQKFFDLTILLLHWLTWTLRFNWLRDYCLETTLLELIERFKIKKIGCIHEMHSYSRIVWKVAAEHNICAYTIQHAEVTLGKRWYFYYPEERQSGLVLPSVMYMYNKNIIETLRPYFNGTIFKLGCSSRYAHWKGIQKSNNIGKYYLFVGALASFDNKILLTSIKRLLSGSFKTPLPIKVRLHPFAILSRTLRRWLALNARVGRIELSKNINLKDDLNNAIVVIGMSTTVLEEALLLGKPVIQLTHPDFLKYIDISGVRGAREVEYNRLSMQELDNISKIEVDSEAIKMKLGLNEAEVTYQQLFL